MKKGLFFLLGLVCTACVAANPLPTVKEIIGLSVIPVLVAVFLAILGREKLETGAFRFPLTFLALFLSFGVTSFLLARPDFSFSLSFLIGGMAGAALSLGTLFFILVVNMIMHFFGLAGRKITSLSSLLAIVSFSIWIFYAKESFLLAAIPVFVFLATFLILAVADARRLANVFKQF